MFKNTAVIYKNIFMYLVVLITLMDILVIHEIYEPVFIILFIFWLLILKLHGNIENKLDLIGAGLFIGMPLLVIFKLDVMAEKTAIWFFFYLILKFTKEYKESNI